mmetsp:Transcript_27753/g.58663  ORF Transcript_27753/g.58663 Transcript_27753/m.58663 type:complete len:200 (+) Transcript_27753:915-1514(+)
MSSSLMARRWLRSCSRKITSVPKGVRPANLHMLTRCTRERLSRVNSSLKSFANWPISSFDADSPFLIFWMNSFRASALAAFFPPFFCLMLEAISSTVSCRKEATSSFTRSFFFRFSSCFSLSWKVEGNMSGKMARATGSRSSKKGITRKISIGTMRKMSAVVRVSCIRSRRERAFPPSDFLTYLLATFTSVHSSLVPTQ